MQIQSPKYLEISKIFRIGSFQTIWNDFQNKYLEYVVSKLFGMISKFIGVLPKYLERFPKYLESWNDFLNEYLEHFLSIWKDSYNFGNICNCFQNIWNDFQYI